MAAFASVRRFRPGRELAVAWLFGIARHKLLELRSLAAAWKIVHAASSGLCGLSTTTTNSRASTTWPAPSWRNCCPPCSRHSSKLPPFARGSWNELPYDEVAARLRCSALVARKRVSRGLATLRDVLEER